MRAHVAQKVLPLALCFAAGVGLAAAGESLRSANGRRSAARSGASETHSRTWLIVKSNLPRAPVARSGIRNFASSVHFREGGVRGFISPARFRARFEKDGTVSAVTFLPEPGSSNFSHGAEDVVRHVRFVPPTEDGRPLAATADVVCEMANVYPRPDARGIYYIYAPNVISLSVKIVSVEGASSREGWRVVYE